MGGMPLNDMPWWRWRSNVRSAYDPKAADLSVIFSTAGAAPSRAERAHA